MDEQIVPFRWNWGRDTARKKVLVLNGSPKKGGSSTMRVTEAFLSGLPQEACEIERINVSDLNITPCLGCLSCWNRTDGICVIQDDDMAMLKKKILEADVIIESFPLYFFGMPGTLKVMTDRLLGMLCRYQGQTPEPGKAFHGFRCDLTGKRFLIVSTCGYAQTDLIYDPLLNQFDCILGPDHYQALLCPQGKTLQVPELWERMDMFLKKYTEAGTEFAINGCISETTMKKLSEPPFNERRFRLLLNQFW